MIRRWLLRRAVAWERKHPAEAKELMIKFLEGYIGHPLSEENRQIIRDTEIDYGDGKKP